MTVWSTDKEIKYFSFLTGTASKSSLDVKMHQHKT